MSNSDVDWKNWGKQDPYYGVLAHPKFRRSELNEDSLQEFFETGRTHVEHVLGVVSQRLCPGLEPSRVLDYGCGVGRLIVPFAERCEHVTGIDVSADMLNEAAKNAEQRGLANVQLVAAENLDSIPDASFDFIHSFIVFQHIPTKRGEIIFRKLLQKLKPRGSGAIHFTYTRHASRLVRLAYEIRKRSTLFHRTMNLVQKRPISDPVMQGNSYSLQHIFDILFAEGCGSVYTEFTKHNNVVGLMIYFEKFQPAYL